MFEIEQGTPIPDAKGGHPEKYPWSKMNIGDSFFIAADKKRINPLVPPKLRGAGFKISIRKVEGGLRVWRVA